MAYSFHPKLVFFLFEEVTSVIPGRYCPILFRTLFSFSAVTVGACHDPLSFLCSLARLGLWFSSQLASLQTMLSVRVKTTGFSVATASWKMHEISQLRQMTSAAPKKITKVNPSNKNTFKFMILKQN